MFSEIAEIKSIREQKSRLSEREKELTEPILTDLDMIGQLWEWFKEVLSHRNCPPRLESVTQRKKFIFIILLLYAPGVLAGYRTPKGLRSRISEVVGIPSKSCISRDIDSLLFSYQQYNDFEQDVDSVFTEMMKRVKPGD